MKKPYITDANIEVESFDGKTITGYSLNGKGRNTIKVEGKNGVRTLTSAAKNNLPSINPGSRYDFTLEEDNVLCISKWKMKQTSEGETAQSEFMNDDYNDSDWLDVTIGAWEMQLPQEREHEDYPVQLLYRTSFEITSIPSRLALLIDGFSGSSYELYINGKQVNGELKRSKLDAEIKEVDIKDYVQEGRNLVAVKLCVQRRTDGILDLLKIIGDFSLTPQLDFYTIDKLPGVISIGDWTKKGYPFYSGTGVYTTEVNIPAEYLDGKLFLEADCGEDVLEVIINDSESRIVPWHPYRIDITGLLKEGNNKIEFKVTNTLINILEAVKQKSGLFRKPKIVHYNKYSFTL